MRVSRLRLYGANFTFGMMNNNISTKSILQIIQTPELEQIQTAIAWLENLQHDIILNPLHYIQKIWIQLQNPMRLNPHQSNLVLNHYGDFDIGNPDSVL